jgi:hypothetical protein
MVGSSWLAFGGFTRGAINRDVGSGPLDNINWMLPVSRLILGAEGAELSCKSSSLDEPLTPTNFNIKADSTQGSANVNIARIDKKGIFVQNGGTRVFELDRGDAIDYAAIDLTVLIPEICAAQVSRMAVQRKPDTRIHCVLADGTVALAVIDRVENVLCWFNVSTALATPSSTCACFPGALGSGEDAVYYAVARAVNGSTVYYLERWALESSASAGRRTSRPTLRHLQPGGEQPTSGRAAPRRLSVVVWDNGKCLRDANDDIATFTVDGSGQITSRTPAPLYRDDRAWWALLHRAVEVDEARLRRAGRLGAQPAQEVRPPRRHPRPHASPRAQVWAGLQHPLALPLIENGTTVAEDTIHQHYDEDPSNSMASGDRLAAVPASAGAAAGVHSRCDAADRRALEAMNARPAHAVRLREAHRASWSRASAAVRARRGIRGAAHGGRRLRSGGPSCPLLALRRLLPGAARDLPRPARRAMAARRAMEMIAMVSGPVDAYADPQFPGSEVLLEHMGFRHLGGRVYRYGGLTLREKVRIAEAQMKERGEPVEIPVRTTSPTASTRARSASRPARSSPARSTSART